MEVLHLTATQFIKPMSAGRNLPLLLGSEDMAGGSVEVVVKFRGKEMDAKSQIAELITAQLADDLGLQSAQPAIIDVPTAYETIIPERDLVARVKNSPGLNFGSVHLGAGFTTWARKTPYPFLSQLFNPEKAHVSPPSHTVLSFSGHLPFPSHAFQPRHFRAVCPQ
jgi:hypothetical protein